MHIPKAAGSSIRQTLFPYASKYQISRQLFNHTRKVIFKHDFSSNLLYRYHVHAHEIRDFMGADKYNIYFSFAFTRHPLSRVASQYKFILKNRFHPRHLQVSALTFNEFIDLNCNSSIPLTLQSSFTHCDGRKIVSEIYKLSDIEASFSHLCSTLQIKPLKVKSVNITNSRLDKLSLSPASLSKLLEMLKPDYDYLNYDSDYVPSSILVE